MGNYTLLGQVMGAAQQQWVQTECTTTSNALYWNDGLTPLVYGVAPEPAKPKAKGPETVLEWLDRRVSEMCVAL